MSIAIHNCAAQNGSLAVPGGRDIVTPVNKLLSLPFALKVATKDWHPQNHISFASNHDGAVPFSSWTTIVNPANPKETYQTRLWPDHCVIDTPGAELLPELNTDKLDKVITKGSEPRVEMYSAFRSPLNDPPLATAVSDLAKHLGDAGITDVVVVGLAGDYCVKCSALHSVEEGWRTYVVEDAVRSVSKEDWENVKEELEKEGVRIVNSPWVEEVSYSLLTTPKSPNDIQ